MYIKTVIIREGPLASKKATRKVRNQVVKRGLQWILEFWHEHFLPRHFGDPRTVESRYRGVFAKRSKRYQIRKAKKYGHTRLLEWSGEMKRSILSSFTVGGSSKKAWIALKYPLRRKKGKGGFSSMPQAQIDKELTAISPSEDVELGEVFGEWFVKEIDKVKDRDVVRVK